MHTAFAVLFDKKFIAATARKLKCLKLLFVGISQSLKGLN